MDASAAVAALLNDGQARERLTSERVWAPEVIDVEVVNGLRSCLARGRIDEAAAQAAFTAWQGLGIRRVSGRGLLPRVWELREVLDTAGASYVALAEALDCAVVTADAKLSAITAARCPVLRVAN
ncbi:type II toxin-antitoxin system VapC family toxin [Mycolicibacterium hodleri]|uniref:type II toxin-antitoxin system VapC family toxin n=1 Tax=Mycolicibacterium hodleri TaxID=49897 RepID=UPI0021F30B36|nr:type II toxin-antitoxin system VapC family toxin [Mycolicibacterium hodleri]